MSSRCPFPAALLLFAGVVFLSAVLSRVFPGLAGAGLPILGPLAATAAAGIALETRRRSSCSCPWLDAGLAGRGTLYFLLFVVGVFVVFPGLYPSLDIPWYARIPLLLLGTSSAALLRLHAVVDHGEFETAGVGKGTYYASRLPAYLVIAGIAAAVLAGLAELILTLMGRTQ